MSTRWTESGRPQGRPLRWTDGRAQCGAIGTVVEHLKGRFHARCQTLSNGGKTHLLVLSSGGRHGPRIDRTHGLPAAKLELSVSTTDIQRTPMGAETF